MFRYRILQPQDLIGGVTLALLCFLVIDSFGLVCLIQPIVSIL